MPDDVIVEDVSDEMVEQERGPSWCRRTSDVATWILWSCAFVIFFFWFIVAMILFRMSKLFGALVTDILIKMSRFFGSVISYINAHFENLLIRRGLSGGGFPQDQEDSLSIPDSDITGSNESSGAVDVESPKEKIPLPNNPDTKQGQLNVSVELRQEGKLPVLRPLRDEGQACSSDATEYSQTLSSQQQTEDSKRAPQYSTVPQVIPGDAVIPIEVPEPKISHDVMEGVVHGSDNPPVRQSLAQRQESGLLNVEVHETETTLQAEVHEAKTKSSGKLPRRRFVFGQESQLSESNESDF